MNIYSKLKRRTVTLCLVLSLLLTLLTQNFLLSPKDNVKAATTDMLLEDNAVYFIKNQKSNLYLDVRNYSGENGAKLNQLVQRKQIKYLSISGFEYLDEKFYDLSTGEELSFDYINSVF